MPRARLTRLLLAALFLAGCNVPAPWEGPRPLRILVYNIHAGKDAKGVDNLQRVADIVKQADADIVLLQEVDQGTRRSGNVDQPRVLSDKAKRRVAFGASLANYDGGRYGIAVLSRWPITSQVEPLPVEPSQERAGGSHEARIALVTQIESPYGRLHVVNTHLDASGDDRYRVQEVATVLSIVDRLRREPGARVLVGGDFNSTPDSPVQGTARERGLRDAWRECGIGEAMTYPADVPRKRIDYLFLTGNASCGSGRVIETQASDHRPVLFEVRP